MYNLYSWGKSEDFKVPNQSAIPGRFQQNLTYDEFCTSLNEQNLAKSFFCDIPKPFDFEEYIKIFSALKTTFPIRIEFFLSNGLFFSILIYEKQMEIFINSSFKISQILKQILAFSHDNQLELLTIKTGGIVNIIYYDLQDFGEIFEKIFDCRKNNNFLKKIIFENTYYNEISFNFTNLNSVIFINFVKLASCGLISSLNNLLERQDIVINFFDSLVTVKEIKKLY